LSLKGILKWEETTRFIGRQKRIYSGLDNSGVVPSSRSCTWHSKCDDYEWKTVDGKRTGILNSCKEEATLTEDDGKKKIYHGNCNRHSCDGNIPEICDVARKGTTCWDKCEQKIEL